MSGGAPVLHEARQQEPAYCSACSRFASLLVLGRVGRQDPKSGLATRPAAVAQPSAVPTVISRDP